MGVNISGWDRKCSHYCDDVYNAEVERDPANILQHRDKHLRCLTPCLLQKGLKNRLDIMK